MLSQRLAASCGWLHVVEVDRRLELSLREAVAPFANVLLHFGDAMEVDLGASIRRAGKVVANLPYGIAATVILRTIDELPNVSNWVVMAQREVGERLAAAPGPRLTGVFLCAGAARLRGEGAAAVGRTVFRPVPNSTRCWWVCDGSVRAPRMRARACPRRVRTPAKGIGGLAGAGHRCGAGRARAGSSGAGFDRTPGRRARGAARSRGVSRVEQKAFGVRLRALAPGKVNLCLFLGPTRDDGRHELVTLLRVAVAGR